MSTNGQPVKISAAGIHTFVLRKVRVCHCSYVHDAGERHDRSARRQHESCTCPAPRSCPLLLGISSKMSVLHVSFWDSACVDSLNSVQMSMCSRVQLQAVSTTWDCSTCPSPRPWRVREDWLQAQFRQVRLGISQTKATGIVCLPTSFSPNFSISLL